MKKSYTNLNISLESAGDYESHGWYLSVADILGLAGNLIAVDEKEIPLIAEVCERWMKDREK